MRSGFIRNARLIIGVVENGRKVINSVVIASSVVDTGSKLTTCVIDATG